MKKTIITISIAVILTIISCEILYAIKKGRDKLWLISSVKEPMKRALLDIDNDINENRIISAKKKIKILKEEWNRFNKEPGFTSKGLGDIMVKINKINNQNEVASPNSDSDVAKPE